MAQSRVKTLAIPAGDAESVSHKLDEQQSKDAWHLVEQLHCSRTAQIT